MKKKVILCPNPYRDRNFQTMRNAMQILRNAGIQPKLCLPFEVDRNYELPKDLRFSRLDRELPNAELVICFGGDGTILHTAKAATRRGIPLLGVNNGTMGGFVFHSLQVKIKHNHTATIFINK